MPNKTDENLKTIRSNMFLSSIRSIAGVLFPLITFPYISRVLGVENIGRYNFSRSVINYFALLAGLGFNTYAVREGSKLRNNPLEFKKFADEMFSMNMLSTTLSYLLLGIILILVPKLHNYVDLLLILSIQIFFQTIGVEWIYSIYENYAYITVRSLIFQVISLILMFLTVRNAQDTAAYAIVAVISAVGSNIMNFVHARRYCRIGLTLHIDWGKHLKPILILFATSAMIQIYVNSDTTILGFLCNDHTVGIYAVSTRIYSAVKTVLSSVIIVSIPRLSSLSGEGNLPEFSRLSKNIYETLLTIMLPIVTGIIMLRRPIIMLVAGRSYESACSSLFLLCIAIIFCLGAYFWGHCVLVPLGLEKVLFNATCVSAAVNIVLNFVLIPVWQENAAAITTIIAEGITFFWCAWEGMKQIKIRGLGKNIVKITLGCLLIVLISIVISHYVTSYIIQILMTVVISVIAYTALEIALHNILILDIVKGLIRK